MKNRLMIAGLIIIAAFMLASLSSVMATTQTPPLTVSEQGTVWTVDLLHPIDCGVSGKDVIKVEVFWYDVQYPNPPGPNDVPHPLSYLKYSLTDCQVKIWIDTTADFPTTAPLSWVTLTFTGDVVKTFSGPGWTYRFH